MFRVRMLAGHDDGVVDACLETELPFVPTSETGFNHPAFGEHAKTLVEVSYNLEAEKVYAVFPNEQFSSKEERDEMAAWFKDHDWTISHCFNTHRRVTEYKGQLAWLSPISAA